MAILPPTKRRRTATSVLAGDFDLRPQRDVLTSLLNGVPVYKEVENNEELRRARRRKEKEREREREREEREMEKNREMERDKEKKRVKPGPRPAPKLVPAPAVASTSSAYASVSAPPARAPSVIKPPQASSFWQARPAIHIARQQRSVSVTPPPMVSSPPTTPGPSISSTTSATSSKRPHTPADDEDFHGRHRSEDTATPPPQSRYRKKRAAVRKGWKGWVEGSPPPSEKLINLDVATVLPERKTRSGKSFDAIGVGSEGWKEMP